MDGRSARPVINVLVVAVYQEDTAWLEKVPQSWDMMVLRKGIDLPNEGREAGTFLHAMTLPEVRAADWVAFVQGEPFEHCPDLFARLAALAESDGVGGGRPVAERSVEPGEQRSLMASSGSASAFEWLGEPHLSDRMGGPWDRLPIAEKHLRWTDRPMGDSVTFAAGGQFVVAGAAIRRLPEARLDWLRKEAALERNAWAFERLWEAILS